MIRSLFASLAFLLLSAAAPEPAPEARPALWKIADADTTLYLFGTVHALPRDLDWRTDAFDKAFAAADTLTVEVVPDADPAAMLAPMFRLGLSPGLPPLGMRVAEENRPALSELIAKSAVPAEALDQMENWLAALMLLGPSLADAGVDPGSGADNILIAEAQTRKLALIGLETAEQQLGYFDQLDEADQAMLLNAVIEDSRTARDLFHQMLDAWSKGDVATLGQVASDEMKATPGLQEALLTRRNARWAEWLRKRLETPGTVLIAVGAAHLAGADSVQDMLKKQGVAVSRVQ